MRDTPPDLVLLDVVMPGMSGWELLRIRETDERLRGIPVILVSAQDPGEEPLATPALLVTIEGGISLLRTVQLALEVSHLLQEPVRKLAEE
jgi:CheY-like chemotaxis protein